MKYWQAALAASATMFCYTGYAADDAVERQGAALREVCQQIVQDVDQKMGSQVAACVPAASVRHGQPDLLLIVANRHFEQEELRAQWLGLSILAASRAVGGLAADSGVKLTTLMVDEADHERHSLRDIKLCNLSFDEVNTLSHRQDATAHPDQLYRDSSCHRPNAEAAKAAG